jgi:hypothetical protein
VAPQTGLIPPFYSADETERTDTVRYEGTFEEHNVYRGFEGMNVTLGCLGSVSRHLGLGAMVDLPWLAEARQTKDVRNTITTYDRSGSRVLDVSRSATSESRDVEFRFPLHWAVGGVWRWNDRFYTSLDLSQTMWSDFYFQAEGDGRINPIDGSAYGRSEVDDCWSTRVGMEYLWVFRRTEVPLRAGASWEQRPAIGDPDDYWAVSLGTGISMGMDPGKLILDVAYLYTWGDDVLGSLVPGQEGLTTDVRRQDLFVSGIWHF